MTPRALVAGLSLHTLDLSDGTLTAETMNLIRKAGLPKTEAPSVGKDSDGGLAGHYERGARYSQGGHFFA
jgi:hypothetical protein